MIWHNIKEVRDIVLLLMMEGNDFADVPPPNLHRCLCRHLRCCQLHHCLCHGVVIFVIVCILRQPQLHHCLRQHQLHCCLRCGIVVCIVVWAASLLSALLLSIVCIAASLSALSASLSSASLMSALLGCGGESALSCIFVGGKMVWYPHDVTNDGKNIQRQAAQT